MWLFSWDRLSIPNPSRNSVGVAGFISKPQQPVSSQPTAHFEVVRAVIGSLLNESQLFGHLWSMADAALLRNVAQQAFALRAYAFLWCVAPSCIHSSGNKRVGAMVSP